MSNAGIGTGKCIEFQNHKRFSSCSRRRSSNSAHGGYISSHPSQSGGVSMEKGLRNSGIASSTFPSCRARSCAPRLRTHLLSCVYPPLGGGCKILIPFHPRIVATGLRMVLHPVGNHGMPDEIEPVFIQTIENRVTNQIHLVVTGDILLASIDLKVLEVIHVRQSGAT